MKNHIIQLILASAFLITSICALNFYIVGDDVLIYAIMLLTFTLILAIRMKNKTTIWNLVVFIGYNIPLLYCLHYKGEYGTSLYWWVFLLFFNAIHLLGIILFSIITLLKKRYTDKKRFMIN